MSWGRVHVDVFDDFCLQGSRALDGCVEVVELEPQQDSVTVPSTVGVDEVWVVLCIPRVELQDERAIDEEPVVEVVVIRCHQLAGASGTE